MSFLVRHTHLSWVLPSCSSRSLRY